MKILYLITKSNWGGAQKYVFDLADYFNKLDNNVLVAFGGSGLLKERLEKENINTIEIKKLSRDINFLTEFQSFSEIFKILKKENPDIIHLNSSKVSVFGALAGRILGIKKIIFTAHGFPFREERSFVEILLIKFFSWLTIILSHKTICVSQKDFDDVKNWLFVKNKLLVIHNGIKLEEDIKVEHDPFKENNIFGIGKGKVRIVSIAELHKNKGLEYGIRTINLLKDRIQNFTYTIFSFGGDEEFNLRKLIKDFSLEDFIEIKIINKNEKINLKEFDIYFLPSIKEGLPYVLLEAGVNSLPMVASDTGGVGEIVENYKNGFLINSKDINGFLLALEKLILDEKLREDFGEKAKEKIIKDFLFENMIRNIELIYK